MNTNNFDLNRDTSCYEAMFYTRLSSGDIKCTLCPRGCTFKDGVVGACHVRQRVGDKLCSLSYLKGVGFHVDPIEKKPLFHFYPGAPIFSFGTFGCNLHCKFCQNDTLSHPSVLLKTKDVTPSEIIKVLLDNNLKLLAFTYNEPTVFIEYIIETASLAKENNIKTVLVTNGFINKEPRDELYKYVDAVNIDLKSFDDEFYKNVCAASLAPVLDTILYANQNENIWLELTNLIIPKYNDDFELVKKMIKWIQDNLGNFVPLHFSSFFPAYKMMDTAPTSIQTLIDCRNLALDMGLKYVYIGNTRNEDLQSTYCYNCGKVLIERNSYFVKENLISDNNGACPYCGSICKGVF